MRIVHTADWHVGKPLRGKNRYDEMTNIFAELLAFLESREVDLLLVAGDIYDTFTPAAQAEQLVYNFLYQVSQLKVKTVLIAGNHDSGIRFEAVAGLMAIAGVHIFGVYEDRVDCFEIETKDGQRAQVFPVPFISERQFIQATDLEKDEGSRYQYSKAMGQVFQKIVSQIQPNVLNIAMGHLLIHGAKPGAGERQLYLGENYAVHPQEIPEGLDYIALGHIHRFQMMNSTCCPAYYCGSPIQLDFGEKNIPKGFLYLDIAPGDLAHPEFVPFENGKQLFELTGSAEEITAIIEKNPQYQDAYLKINLIETEASFGEARNVKKMFPGVVDIRKEKSKNVVRDMAAFQSHWIPEWYKSYYNKQYQASPTKPLMTKFENIYESCSED